MRWADAGESTRAAAVIDEIKAMAEAGFPDELEWEALVDVLRGKVKVNTHVGCRLPLSLTALMIRVAVLRSDRLPR